MEVNGYEIQPNAHLINANLRDANLSGANLINANLSGANLINANLSGANLYRANLYRADLEGANLRDANLSGADLYRADLYRANLSEANLSDANLSDADLRGADLRGADLYRANLSDADLRGADLYNADLPHFQIVPEVGLFHCWKKVMAAGGDPVILELLVPSSAKRTSCLTSRKCRISHARVLGAWNIDGRPATGEFRSCTHFDNPLTYRVGDLVEADSFDDDIRVECSHGIHVFLTRKEAEEW